MPPTDQEIQQAADVLNRLKPGFLPSPVFLAITRLAVTPTIEMVPFRSAEDGSVEVLLTRRPPTDTYWPGMLHVPGSVFRATDHEGSYQDVFDRIFRDELPGVTPVGEPQYVGNWFHQVRRGRELAVVHFVAVQGLMADGAYYPVSALPPEIIDHQVGFIHAAAKAFADS